MFATSPKYMHQLFLIRRALPAVLLVYLALISQGCNYYSGPQSDHYDGSRFYNQEPGQSFRDHLKWMWEMETVAWPEWIDDPPQPLPTASVGRGELRATYINQATVLIQMDEINILTDPFWSEKAGPASWIGAPRIRAPGVPLKNLPHINMIIISHDHYDHLDIPTLKLLVDAHNPIILVGLGVKARLSALKQARIIELDWWDEYPYNDLMITFVPTRHNSGRGLFDDDKTLWGGYVLQGPQNRVLFLGDTAFGGFFEDLNHAFPDFRLAIMPVGSYEPYWFMGRAHMNPNDAVLAHQLLNVQTSLGIHFATLAEHPQQPLNAHEVDLAIALSENDIPPSNFILLGFGAGRDF
ncbi:MBL fold metallo-hydrolase [Candidatus Neomarinimicrobiota bacterium]